jgi:ribosomal protein S18 acetylase RimI-like enzyme
VGQALVGAFLEEAKQHGLKHVNLTTDRDNNDLVNHFYQEFGFRCYRSFITPEGRAMIEYVIDV